MNKLATVLLTGALLFPAISSAQVATSTATSTPTMTRAELIANLTAKLQVLIKMYYEALSRELTAKLAAQNLVINQIQATQSQQGQQIQQIANNAPVEQVGGTGAPALPQNTPVASSTPVTVTPPTITFNQPVCISKTQSQWSVNVDDWTKTSKVRVYIYESPTIHDIKPAYIYKADTPSTYGNIDASSGNGTSNYIIWAYIPNDPNGNYYNPYQQNVIIVPDCSNYSN